MDWNDILEDKRKNNLIKDNLRKIVQLYNFQEMAFENEKSRNEFIDSVKNIRNALESNN